MTRAGGFKVADAYADFRMDVDKAIGDAMAKLRASGNKFDRMGRDAGENFSKGFSRGLDLTKGFDKAVEGARTRTNQLQRLGNDAGEGYSRGFRTGINLRSAMVEQVGVVKSARPAFAAEGKQAGQAYARGFSGQRVSGPTVGGASGAGAAGEAAGNAYGNGFARGSARGGRQAEDSLSKNADRIQAKFSALKFLALSQGLPAAAAVGTAATAGIVTGAVALFAGLGVAGAYGAEQVSLSWTKTLNTVTHGVTELSHSYEGELVTASEMVGKSFARSSGLIEKGMLNSQGAVVKLTGAGLDLAENALPGIVTASGRLEPVLDGIGDLASDVGTGLGEMAANASKGSDAAGKSLTTLGDILRTTEARTGSLAANLANASAGPLNSFRYQLDQITGAALDVTQQGSGLLGFLGGFTTTTSGAVTVARGLLGAVNALPPQLTMLAGSVSTTSMIMSRLGVDAGAGWDGLGAKIRNAGKELKGSEKFAAKAGTAIGGLAAGALNPAALAVGALSIGLLLLGQRQEEAAQAAAEHRESVRQLTDAIRQDNGAIGEHTATTIANALASKNVAENAGRVGISMGQSTLAAIGNQRAMDAVSDATNRSIQALKGHGIEGQRDLDGLKRLNKGLLENGGSFASLGSEVYKYTEGLFNGKNPAEAESLTRTLDLSGAIGEQAKATREAYNGYLLQEQGLTGLTEAQIKARDATIDHTKAIYEQQNAELGYRGAVQSTKEAQDTYNKIVKEGKLNTDEGTRATLALENAFAQQEQAAYNAAYANSKLKTDQEKAKEATEAMNRETVNLANSFAGPLPASLQATIARMSVTSAKAAGLKVDVNNLGQAVYTLPNGKQIVLDANNQNALDAIAEVQRQLNAVRDKRVTLTMNTTYTYSGTSRGPNGSLTGSARFSADGNLFKFGAQRKAVAFADGGTFTPMGMTPSIVPANTDRIVGDNPSVPESYIPHKPKDARAQQILSETNRAFGVTVQAPAPNVENHYHITAPPMTDIPALAAAVSREIMLRGK